MAVLFTMPDCEPLANSIVSKSDMTRGKFTHHTFPDGETYIRLETPVQGKDVIVLCSLDHPNDKILPLIMLSSTARDLGANSIGLICPYLAYMRQDKSFKPGEGITSKYFADLLSTHFNWLVTIDPHLHRYSNLADVYSIPATVIHADGPISDWIHTHIDKPLIVGPDSESKQWVASVADQIGAPYIVLQKERFGDHDVKVHIPDLDRWKTHTPIVVDDIISTAGTMMDTVQHLRDGGLQPPVCIGVHALFPGTAYDNLMQAGAEKVVTCNTISHPTNEIDIAPLLVRFINTHRVG